MTLSSATTPGLSGPGSDGNKRVLCIPQNSSITGASPSDCLVPYLGRSLGEYYLSAEKQQQQQDTNCTATCLLPRKLFKLD